MSALYRYTSIARPVEPDYPTNKAVLIAMPVVAALGAALAYWRGEDFVGALSAAAIAALAFFGAWALARELAPDDNAAAFVAAGAAVVGWAITDGASLLLLFVALFLARIVNRSVGPPARLTDSLVVAALVTYALYRLDSPLLGLIGALAFVADALLPAPARRQSGFAALCLAATVVYSWQNGWPFAPGPLPSITGWTVAAITIAFVVAIVATRHIRSGADIGGQPLQLQRVKAGMLLALLVAGQTLVYGAAGIESGALLWATLAGVAVGTLLRRLQRALRRNDS